jgi:AcrR family transcriptional regulator
MTTPLAGPRRPGRVHPAAERGPGRPRREDVDERILDATIDELEEHGYRAVSIEAVAARAGVAKTTVYRRWPSKDELVFDAISKLKGPIPQVPGKGLREDLMYLMERMRRNWVNSRHGRVMRQLSAEGSRNPELYQAFRDRLVAPRQAAIFAVLRKGIEDGEIRADVDLQWVNDLLVAPVMVAVLTHRPHVSRAQLEFTIDSILRGITP